jgi:UDP-N-acetylmuramoylalanine--D-glutamate ligase
MNQTNLHVVVGLGATGLSCARYLRKQNIPFALVDSRATPPNLAEIQQEFPSTSIMLGQLSPDMFSQASVLVVSPGISLKEPAIAEQIDKGKTVIGDIELFAKATQAPIIAITGTNAKSTVTTLVGKMVEEAGITVQVGGNLGIPALDLLKSGTEAYVLELSSFQLETTHSLAPQVATILNITPDHMDRYDTLEDYRLAKYRIYSDCQVAVCNRDDPSTDCGDQFSHRKLYFTLQEPRDNEFGLINKNGEVYLAFEDAVLMPTCELPILGRHYQANALASLALGFGYGLPFEPMLKTLRQFKGLPHRCQLILERNHVRWYNDSKGTNVGATLAAIEGLGSEINGKLILIAGGVGKNADFTTLVPAIEKYAKAVVLLGESAKLIADVIGHRVDIHFAQSMREAVEISDQLATANDCVLLSPACASFDMFKNFEHRGEVFSEIVMELSP